MRPTPSAVVQSGLVATADPERPAPSAVASPASRPPEPYRTLDVRGLACPIPVARAAQTLTALTPGHVLEVLATDPDAELDVRAWATRSGDDVLSVEHSDDFVRILVRRRP